MTCWWKSREWIIGASLRNNPLVRNTYRDGFCMKRKWQVLVLGGVAALTVGCSQLGYFVQAAHGQFSLLSEARPIDEWLANPAVGEKLKNKLTKVKEIRKFAAQELALPDNSSYTTYADLKRQYVLW